MKNKGFIRKLILKIYNMKIFNPIRKIAVKLRKKIEKSIRFEAMAGVAICFVISFIFYAFASDFFIREEKYGNIEYDYESIENSAKNYFKQLSNSDEEFVYEEDTPESSTENNSTKYNEKYFEDFFKYFSGSQIGYITDLDGKVLYRSENAVEDKVDIFQILSKTMSINNSWEEGQAKSFIYPLTLQNQKYYFIYSDVPKAEISYEVIVKNNNFLVLILSCIIFILSFLIITNNKMKYLDEIAQGLKRIANGELDYRIEEKGKDEFKNLAVNINYMSEEIKKKIEAERNAEKTKADLITNVSHDLRTPLTSIMGYIGLIKNKKYDNEETMMEYLNIAFKKSEKLKCLIEDLFEYTKLNNDGIKLKLSEVNLNEFILQLTDELAPIFDENGITIINKSSEEGIMVNVDTDKMLRVFENLLTNAIKYSYKPGKVIIGVYKSEKSAIVAIKNKGQNIPKEKLDRLFDRFYRVDESRNAEMGGSGLGLAISKNIIELHGGKIWAECEGEDISFYVKLNI